MVQDLFQFGCWLKKNVSEQNNFLCSPATDGISQTGHLDLTNPMNLLVFCEGHWWAVVVHAIGWVSLAYGTSLWLLTYRTIIFRYLLLSSQKAEIPWVRWEERSLLTCSEAAVDVKRGPSYRRTIIADPILTYGAECQKQEQSLTVEIDILQSETTQVECPN